MRNITREQLANFLTEQDPPCISFYMPTHRRHPENQQDPIRFKNLLQGLENTLSKMEPHPDCEGVLQNFRSFTNNTQFWNHRFEGLAILASRDVFHVFDLQRPVAELVVVADSFHIKPLLRVTQATDRFQILGLNRHEARLFEGNRDAVDEIELAEGVPATIDQALGTELTEPHLTVASYGQGAGRLPGIPAMHHGHGQKKDEVDIDNDRFFRIIDRAILEHHSRPSGLPLILAALPEHHGLFRKNSHNPFLVAEGIKYDPKSISIEQLRTEAWAVMEPHYRKRIAGLVDSYEESRSRQLAASDLMDIAQSLVLGRVGTLLIEADRQIPGKLDPVSGKIQFDELADPTVDDLLDDLAEMTLKTGGDVMVIPADSMPSTSGAAAIYRF
jgi:hypothetical protein